jgi:hypothetical protein
LTFKARSVSRRIGGACSTVSSGRNSERMSEPSPLAPRMAAAELRVAALPIDVENHRNPELK